MLRLFIVVLLLFPNIAFSESIYDDKHLIDIWQEDELKYAKTTEDILNVYSRAYEKWGRALNDTYQKLMQKIPAADRKLLRDSQRKWLAFKDSELKFMALHIQRQGGSLSRVITVQRRVALIRNRVIELEAYNFIFDSPP
jgi:uncharacterized protein YecT (DUF1311 family)